MGHKLVGMAETFGPSWIVNTQHFIFMSISQTCEYTIIVLEWLQQAIV